MNNSVYPCLWFDGNAKTVAEYYMTVFGDASIIADAGIVVTLQMSGQNFMLLNGGPDFKINPSVSFMVMTDSEEEVETLWSRLIIGGSALMELGSYPWSKKYGWVSDKFGVSWQLYAGKKEDIVQKYTPTLMFTGNQNGKAEAAVQLYTSIFPESAIQGIMKYTEGSEDTPGNVQHAQFSIKGYTLMCMDSTGPHAFGFNEGISLVVACKDQQEIDTYWDALIANGGAESMCGWLKDQFGLSWQIIPQRLFELMSKGDSERSGKMMNALMKMKKLDIAELEAAYNS